MESLLNLKKEIVHLLLEHGADPLVQDGLGNCPAHVVPQFQSPDTVKLFSLLAATEDVLLLQNEARVKPGILHLTLPPQKCCLLGRNSFPLASK